ncbi:hypothetical protein B566_EDAN011478 [Ephemera danica]|nr:hypothetical protein B566_EDAN011478 [Ephemera danica]
MMRLALLVFLCCSTAAVLAQDCPECDISACDNPNCPGGQVFPEPCPCCPVCTLSEGERCYNKTLKVLKKPEPGTPVVPCGENMDCLLRHDLKSRDAPEALCVCRQADAVCGSDGRTYENICVLAKVAGKHAVQGATLGFPIPDIHWEFKGDDGNIRNLPSDDLYVSVQVRGGPESYMVTSWVQIVDLRPTDTGTYTCVATNSEGVVRAPATVGVYTSVRYKNEAETNDEATLNAARRFRK